MMSMGDMIKALSESDTLYANIDRAGGNSLSVGSETFVKIREYAQQMFPEDLKMTSYLDYEFDPTKTKVENDFENLKRMGFIK